MSLEKLEKLGTVHINPIDKVVVIEIRHYLVEDGREEFRKSENVDMSLAEYAALLGKSDRLQDITGRSLEVARKHLAAKAQKSKPTEA